MILQQRKRLSLGLQEGKMLQQRNLMKEFGENECLHSVRLNNCSELSQICNTGRFFIGHIFALQTDVDNSARRPVGRDYQPV